MIYMGQINQQAYHGFACAKIHDQVVGKFASVGGLRRAQGSGVDTGRAHRPRFHGLIGGRSDVAVQAAPTLPGGCPPPDGTPGPTAAAPWSDIPDVIPCPSPRPTLPLRHRHALAPGSPSCATCELATHTINTPPCPSHSDPGNTASSRKHLLAFQPSLLQSPKPPSGRFHSC